MERSYRFPQWIKCIGMALVLTLAINILGVALNPYASALAVEYAQEQNALAEASANAGKSVAEDEAKYVRELGEERTNQSSTFLLEDGSKVEELYGEAVRYQDENGVWRDIDNSITDVETSEARLGAQKQQGFEYKNTQGAADVLFSDEIEDVLGVRLQADGYTLSMGLMSEEAYAASQKLQPNDVSKQQQKLEQLREEAREEVLRKQNVTSKPELSTPETGSVPDILDAQKQAEIDAAVSKVELPKAEFEVAKQRTPQQVIDDQRSGKSAEEIEAETPEKRVGMVYNDIGEDGATIKLTPTIGGTKEDIVLYEKPTQTTYRFQVDAGGLVAVLNEFGGIDFYAPEDVKHETVIAQMPRPCMFDSYDNEGDNHYSEDVHYELEKRGNVYVVSIVADPAYFEREDLVYPVTIDPTVQLTLAYGSGTISDTYIGTESPNTPPTSSTTKSTLKVGHDSNGKYFRSMLKLTDAAMAPYMNGQRVVTEATLRLFEDYGSATRPWQVVHAVSVPWNESTATWNNIGGNYYGGTVDARIQPNPNSYENYFNLTALFIQWQQGLANNGILIKNENEGPTEYKRYRSTENSNGTTLPVWHIRYVDGMNPVTPSWNGGALNSSQGYINLSWTPIPGVDRYKVAIFNGKEQQYFESDSPSSFTTQGKKIYPTSAEIQQGRYWFHDEANEPGQGTEFANDPRPAYSKQNDRLDFHTVTAYHVRVVPADQNGFSLRLEQSAFVGDPLPDRTKPSDPTEAQILLGEQSTSSWSEGSGRVDSTKTTTISVSWSAPVDQPQGMASGLHHYVVKAWQQTGANAWMQIGTKTIQVSEGTACTFYDVPQNGTTVKATVQAFDTQGNWSAEVSAEEKATQDVQGPAAPATLTIDQQGWSRENPRLSWTGLTDVNILGQSTLQRVEYKTGNGPWTTLNVTQAQLTSGTAANVVVDATGWADGIHTIYVRGVDDQGNAGTSRSVEYSRDTTAPAPEILAPLENAAIQGIVPLQANPGEEHGVESWSLQYAEGETPGATDWQPVPGAMRNFAYFIPEDPFIPSDSGYITVPGGWAVGALENGPVQLRLTVTDTAGNSTTITRALVKGPAESIAPELEITQPNPLAALLPTLTADTPVVYADKESESWAGMVADLYIDGVHYATQTGEEVPIAVDPFAFDEGSWHKLYVETVDGQGNHHYSTTMYTDLTLEQSFAASAGDAELEDVEWNAGGLALSAGALSGTVQTTVARDKLKSLRVEAEADGDIVYEVSADNGATWQPLSDTEAWTYVDGTPDQVLVRATLSRQSAGDTSPRLTNWKVYTQYADWGDNFCFVTISSPTGLGITPNVNYTNALRWDASSTEDVTYNVYRANILDGEYHLMASGLTTTYWNDFNLSETSQTFDYRVSAVKQFDGQSEPRVSLPCVAERATVVASGELDKRLGLQDYWGYGQFTTGSGVGYINLGKGNLAYQATDAVSTGPRLAMVMRRTYNSQSTSKTALGYGWDFSFNTNLLREYAGDGSEIGIILKDGDGTIHRFAKAGDTYQTPVGIHMALAVDETSADETYRILRYDNIEYVYNRQMQLQYFSEPNGNRLTMEYDERGNLIRVSNNVGKSMELVYGDGQDPNTQDLVTMVLAKNAEGELAQVSKYTYDGQQRITRQGIVADETGSITNSVYGEQYTYASPTSEEQAMNRAQYTPIIAVTNAEDQATQLGYDTNRALETVTDAESEAIKFIYPHSPQGAPEITHLISRAQTIAQSGGQPTTSFHIEPESGKTLSVTNAIGNTTTYTYGTGEDEIYDVLSASSQNEINGSLVDLTTYYTYDSKHNLESTTDTEGNVTEIFYNDFNKPISIETPISSGRTATTSMTYDDKGNLTSQTNPEGQTVSYTYDYENMGNRISATNVYGNTTSYAYDSIGRLISTTDPADNTSTVQAYNVQDIPVSIADVEGRVTEYEYDLLGRQTKVTFKPDENSNGSILQRVYYDKLGNVDKKYDAKGYMVDYTYDDVGRTIKVAMANVYVETDYAFDSQHNVVVTEHDQSGKAVIKYYDKLRRLVKQDTTKQGSSETIEEGHYTYDQAGNLIASQNKAGRVQTAEYDTLGRIKKITVDPGGANHLNAYTTMEYDLQGNILETTDALGNTTTNTYDDLGRLLTVAQKPNKNGAETYTTTYTYDNVVSDLTHGQLVYSTVTDALGSTNGQVMRSYANGLGQTVRTEVQSQGQTRTTQYAYDTVGNITRETRTDNSYIEYTYNDRDQLTNKVYKEADGAEKIGVAYAYDANGNRTSMEGTTYIPGAGTRQQFIDYVYDALNRRTQAQQGRIENSVKVSNLTVNYAYAPEDAGNLSSISYQDGAQNVVLNYEYDDFGRLEQIKRGSSTAATYIYATNGDLDRIQMHRQFGSGGGAITEQRFEYDSSGAVRSIGYYDGTGTDAVLKERHSIQIDQRGYITQETNVNNYETPGKTTVKDYTFDDIGRMIKEVEDGSKEIRYSFDAVGNRTQMQKGTVSEGAFSIEDTHLYTYDVFNQLTQETKNGETQGTYTYDARGNQTTSVELKEKTPEAEEESEGSTDEEPPVMENLFSTYSYDLANQLQSTEAHFADVPLDNVTTFNFYNGDGQRTMQEVYVHQEDPNEGTPGDYTNVTEYFYTGDALLFTSDANGNRGEENIVDLSGKVLASKRFDGEYEDMFFFYNYDIRGSVTNIIQPDGTVAKGYDYDSFGNTVEKGDPQFQNSIQFTGAVQDKATGLYYMNARHYNPSSGRFLQQDTYFGNPAAPWTQHLYTYAGNNPVSYTDPSGHEPVSAIIGLVAVVGLILTGCGYTGSGVPPGPNEPSAPEPTGPTKNDPPGKRGDTPSSSKGRSGYRSAEEAVQAFSSAVYNESMYIMHEYGTIIYSYEEKGETWYGYTDVFAGNVSDAPLPAEDIKALHNGETYFVGFAHTHPAHGVPQFDGGDLMIANNWTDRNAGTVDASLYVSSADRQIRKYDPVRKRIDGIPYEGIVPDGDVEMVPWVAPVPLGKERQNALENQYRPLQESDRKDPAFKNYINILGASWPYTHHLP
ncbi:hypothetical protein FACS189415_1500 [Bacteroidia bacterium]|nr:hypothetical protein FACS189415_1500 [Bacteroidia bacterium]